MEKLILGEKERREREKVEEVDQREKNLQTVKKRMSCQEA